MTLGFRYRRLATAMLGVAVALIVSGCEDLRDVVDGAAGDTVDFTVRIENVATPFSAAASGVFDTPVGAGAPGPAGPGSAYAFEFDAALGHRLSLATMFVQSNDLFYSPDKADIELFPGGLAIDGDVTAQIALWDAGTEVNEEPGVGANQAPRQAGPNSGPDEDGVVQLVDDGYMYPAVADAVRVTISPIGATRFEARIENVGPDTSVLLAPGVWVVHTTPAPVFSAGASDRGEGLEGIAEDGDPSALAPVLSASSGPDTILAPGVFAVTGASSPLFEAGALDRNEGLAALAEDGNPAELAGALEAKTAVPLSGVFNTPVGDTAPGPAPSGGAYEFSLTAAPGLSLHFATMFVQSNDLFYSPRELGIKLFADSGLPIAGDVTDQVLLWDAGTEVNEAPGIGPNQAPRQSGPNTGLSESGPVQPVEDGYSYPNVGSSIKVTVTPTI